MKATLHIVAKPAAPVAAIPLQSNATPRAPALTPKRSGTALFTQRTTIAVLAVLACGVTVWSLAFRLPRIRMVMPVQARAATPVALQGECPSTGLSAEESHQRIQQVRTLMLPDREALLPVLASLEQAARMEGWSFGVTVKPPLVRLPVAPDLARIPVAVVMQAQPLASESAPPFVRLAALLRQVSLLTQKVDVSGLTVRASPQGISEVELELVFWTLNPDEKAAPK
jgi:hypothetical protein